MSESNARGKSETVDLGAGSTSTSFTSDIDGETTATALTSSIGTLLCATRMRLGRDLQLVAQLLHIRYSYLVAIEDGRYEDLPGQAYAVGFVRAYADHLGLDGAEVVRRFKEENSGISQNAPFEFPIPAPDSGVPSGALLLLAVVFGMVVYGSWFSIAGSDRGAIRLIQEVPNRLMALIDSGGKAQDALVENPEDMGVVEANVVETPDSESRELLEAQTENLDQSVTSDVIEEPATPDGEGSDGLTNGSAGEDAAEAAQTDSASVAPARSQGAPATSEEPSSLEIDSDDEVSVGEEESPNSAADGNVDELEDSAPDEPESDPSNNGEDSTNNEQAEDRVESVVELRAVSDSWIQLREGDDLVLTRLLREGETFKVPGQAGLTLMTENAGGLEVLVNGAVLAPLGDEGAIVRGVPIDPLRSTGSAD